LKTLKIISCSLLFTLIAFTFFNSTSAVQEGAQVFETPFYSDYHTQLNDFCQQHPLYQTVKSSQLQHLIKKIENPFIDENEARTHHEKFVQELRKNLALYKADDLENKEGNPLFLQDLVKWIFTQVDLKQSTYNYFYENIHPVNNPIDSYLTLLKSLQANKQFSGLSKHERNEDQYLSGNLPFFLFELPNAASTKVIRMGYPLDSTNRFFLPWITPKPYAELNNYLKQQRHLYVNLMKRKGSEGTCSKALEKLEKTYPKLRVVTLDKNSDFYHQKDLQDSIEASHFKRLYLEKLTAKDGNYYWSHTLDKESWHVELFYILENTHQRYFNSQAILSKEERLNFIELSYLEILEHLVEILQPQSLNITCKQCMDRGPSLYVLWMIKHQVISEAEAKALLLAPPLLIHNRPSYAGKINRFTSAAKKLL